MSKNAKKLVEEPALVSERVAKLTERASVIGAPVAKMLAGGFVDEAEVLVAALEAKKAADEAAARAGRSANRFDLFYRKIAGPLKNGKLPVGVEDREFFYALRDLFPREGRGGGSSDWSNKGVAKSLAALSALGALNVDYEADYRAVVRGEATEAAKLANRRFAVPEKIAAL